MSRKLNPWIVRPNDLHEIKSVLPPKPRLGIGEVKRRRVQWEAEQAKALEGTSSRLGLFQLHKVDWVHFETVKTSRGTLKAGFPDYFIIGKGWSAYLEIKARNTETKAPGKLSAAQRDFHEKLQAAGHEVWTALLPDDLGRVNLWLRQKTEIVVEVTL